MARSRSRRSDSRRRSTPLEFAASVHPGLEEVCGKEIESRLEGAQVTGTQRGWVVFHYRGDTADTLLLRTTEDVFVLLFRTNKLPPERKRALALLTHMGRNSRYWDQAWSRVRQTRRPVKRVTFRVIAQMTGKHPFRRHEVRDAVLTGVQMRWPSWKGWKARKSTFPGFSLMAPTRWLWQAPGPIMPSISGLPMPRWSWSLPIRPSSGR